MSVEIDQEYKVIENIKEQNLIDDGIRFVSSITEFYGAEEGMKVWEAIGAAVAPDIKGKIFFKMITGDAISKRVMFTTPGHVHQAVPIIKCIRTYTGFGLKEAKDAYDRSLNKVEQVEIENIHNRRDFVRELRNFGCQVQ